jgi:hypothetical protein
MINDAKFNINRAACTAKSWIAPTESGRGRIFQTSAQIAGIEPFSSGGAQEALRANRNPMLSVRQVGATLLRLAERQCWAELFQPPPRITRA